MVKLIALVISIYRRKSLKELEKEEGETIEFKASLSDFDDILATISAFSNTKGGTMLIGVSDKGNVVGVDVGKRTLEELSNNIIQGTDPKVFPEIKVSKVGDKSIIEIRISERADKPVFAKGVAYKRVGRSNAKMDRDEIINLLRKSYELSYEDLEAAEIEDIDPKKVGEFIDRAKRARLAAIPDNEIIVLRNLGLLNDKATVAAVLLFGKNLRLKIPWATIKVGKFMEGEFVPTIEKEIDGNLLEQIERSYAEVLSLIRKEVKIEGPVRRDIYEYPPEAIRELIVNAVTHRDYSVKSPIYIKISENRMLIENPGGLPSGITVDDLRRPHGSVLRNPKIANVLYNLGYIEKWGIGTLQVIEKCIANANGEPNFDSNSTFRVEIKSRYRRTVDSSEEAALNYIKRKGKATRRELEKALKLKERTARELLERLQNKGLVVKEGKGKKVEYKLAF